MKCLAVTLFLCVSYLFSSSGSVPVFRFANIYGNHMVLQKAPQRATIWGFGEVGQEVLITAVSEVYRSLIIPGPNNTGIWSTLLVPQVFGGPYTINVYSIVNETKVTLSLEDILFGDVWICSGQSNMQFTVIQSDDGKAAINESSRYHRIRLFTAEMETSGTPLSELNAVMQPWSLPSPKTVGGEPWQYFSAVCWYYAVQLYAKLKYPIGIVATTWGGTPIEAWSSPDALKKCNSSHEAENVLPEPMKGELSVAGPGEYSCLWNAMVYPFLNMTIYGVAWYQGEENAERPRLPYNCTFPAMIDDWRAKWYESTQKNTNEVFPFGFVQLSAVGNSTTSHLYNFAPLRWDQTARYGYVPNARQKNVFMAVAMDLGNPNTPYIGHPTDKKDVGDRLALAGLSIAYGVDLYYSGPLVSEIKSQTEPPSLALEVVFKSVVDEIEVRSRNGFEILCENTTTWIDAKILDSGPTSVLIMPTTLCVAEAVRYAWSDYPCVKKECAVYSSDLPCPPFVKYGPFGVLSSVGNSTTAQQYNFAQLRLDQTAQYGYVPNARQKNVFMAVAMDLGNPNSSYGSMHPTDKKDVGHRLALAGLSIAYGVDLYYSGPLVSEIKPQTEPPSLALEVVFKSVVDKIEVRSQNGFEILCENTTTWIDAKILDSGPTSVLIMPTTLCVADAVRYAWSDYPCVKKECAVYSSDLPCPPFIKYGPFGAVGVAKSSLAA